MPELGEDYVGDHLGNIKDAYQTNNHHFQTYFIALSVFSLFFFSAILFPYVNNSDERYGLNQTNSTTVATISTLAGFINIYEQAQNNGSRVDADLRTAEGDIKNVSLTQPEARQFVNKPLNLSNTLGSSAEPQITSSGENTYIVWKDKSSADEEIVFSNSTNITKVIATVSQTNVKPQVAAFDENVYVLFADTIRGNSDVFLVRSTDRGRTFGNLTNISNNSGTSTDAKMAVNGENVYVVWSDNTFGDREIFFKTITNNGSNFNNDIIQLTNDNGASVEPQLSAFGSNVYVVWIDERRIDERQTWIQNIFFTRSIDNGTHFIRSSNALNTNMNNGLLRGLTIESFQNNIYVLWNREIPYEIYLSSSINNGTSFSQPKIISIKGSMPSLDPDIAVSRNHVYIVWEAYTQDWHIFLRRSVDNATSLESIKHLSWGIGNSDNPQIDAFGENVYVVWRDRSHEASPIGNNNDIFFTSSTDNGESFMRTNISHNLGSTSLPQISTSAESIYVVWTSNPSGNEEVFLNFDKSRFHEVVLDRFSSYKRILRETVFNPFQEINKTINNDTITEKLAISKNVLEKLQNYTKTILQDARKLDSELNSLSNNIIQKSENKSLLVNRSLVEDPARVTIETTMQSQGIRENITSSETTELLPVNVEDDIRRKIAIIGRAVFDLTMVLQDQQGILSSVLNASHKTLAKVDAELADISKRLEGIETPLGAIPVGLRDSVPIFPILVAIGFLICFNLLTESICLRKSFHILYHKKYDGHLMLKSEQTALIAPLWIDPFNSKAKRIVWLTILLVPVAVYLVSIALIWNSTSVMSSLNIGGYFGMVYTIIYIVLLLLMIWLYCKVVFEVWKYRSDIRNGIARSELPECGKTKLRR